MFKFSGGIYSTRSVTAKCIGVRLLKDEERGEGGGREREYSSNSRISITGKIYTPK